MDTIIDYKELFTEGLKITINRMWYNPGDKVLFGARPSRFSPKEQFTGTLVKEFAGGSWSFELDKKEAKRWKKIMDVTHMITNKDDIIKRVD